MALTAQPPAHPNWGRWPQQLPHDFSMMETPGFLPYDSRAPANPQIQRPMPPQYVVDAPYSHAPMQATMPAPQYQSQSAFSYVPYQSPLPSTPVGSPYKQDFQPRPAPRIVSSEADNGRTTTAASASACAYRRDSRPVNDYQPRSPASRSGSVSSASSSHSASIVPSPVVNSKTITYNETINPSDQINFETEVDELMKAIQRKQKRDGEAAKVQQILTPAQTPKSDGSTDASSPVDLTPAQGERKPRKKWVCDGPNCSKSFVQKTHLDIHRRTHTGHKPYVCTKDNCGLTFSQRGNLKTHMRRHTGEKPYSCSMCGKLFAQRGNVRSHEETHKGLKPFVCRLDDCNKPFSQLGNMKTHQNNFHKETLQRLTSLFVQFIEQGEVPESHRELFDYFQEHYKNSNKGIKGRGKARTVAARKPKGAAAQQQPAASAPSTAANTPVAAQFSHVPVQSPSQVMPHAGRLPSYDMGHGGPAHSMDNMPRNPAPVYGMYDQHQHQAPLPPPAPQGGMLYDDEHSRQMGFAGRMY